MFRLIKFSVEHSIGFPNTNGTSVQQTIWKLITKGLCSDMGDALKSHECSETCLGMTSMLPVSRGRLGMMEHEDIPSRKKCDLLLRPLHKLLLAWR